MLYNFRRAISRKISKTFYSIDRRKLVEAFARLGLRKGMTVCVHSALSRLGHIDGGPAAVIQALMETVTEDGCIVMPSYATLDSVAVYLDQGRVFDVRKTPSAAGALTELFRTWPGVKRSLHPTNAMAAWGKHADMLLAGHELSLTPYGDETPFGRLARMEDSYILMLETCVLSLLHHLQERVDFPNYVLDGIRDVTVIDANGAKRVVRTKAMRQRIPYYIAIPPQDGPGNDWALLHDFALLFPKTREQEVRRLYRLGGYPQIFERRAQLTEAGCLAATRLGMGEIGLLHVKPFLDIEIPEFAAILARYRSCYDLAFLETAQLPRYT